MHRWMGAHGVSIAGDTWGDPDKPLVILQHGGGQTRHAWKNCGEKLGSRGYYAVSLDARGHGDSDWAPDGDYSQDAMIDDLVRIIEMLGSRPTVLVGASMGGGTSLVAIGEKRLEATGLVLVDMAPRLEPDGIEKILTFMRQKPDGFDTLEEAAEAISNYQPHRNRKRNLDGLAKNLRFDASGKYRWHWDPRFHRDPPDVEAHLRRFEVCARDLKLPTLLVRGGLSDVLSESGAEDFLAICPHAEYINVTGASHMVAGDKNDIFADAVIEFLNRTLPTK